MVDEGNGKIFPRPKTFREVAQAFGSSRAMGLKTLLLYDFRIFSTRRDIYISPSYIDDDELLLEIPRIPITFVFRSFVNNIFVCSSRIGIHLKSFFCV